MLTHVSAILSKLKMLAAVVGLLFVLGLGVKTVGLAPAHAQVYVDPVTNTYLGVPCATSEQIATLSLTTIAKASSSGYKIDRACRDRDGFSQDLPSLSMTLVYKVLPSLEGKRRWNVDGTWNW